jgi:hypothetical protein
VSFGRLCFNLGAAERAHAFSESKVVLRGLWA